MEKEIVGVLSDTHGNKSLMEKVCRYLLENRHITKIYHLGDNYEDGEYLQYLGFPVWVVPGLWCDQFHDWKTPKVIVQEIMNVKTAFAHTYDLILKSSGINAKICCYGHTHKPEIRECEGKILFNPGHLKKDIDRGIEASFGVIEYTDDNITFEILSASNPNLKLSNRIIPRKDLLAEKLIM